MTAVGVADPHALMWPRGDVELNAFEGAITPPCPLR